MGWEGRPDNPLLTPQKSPLVQGGTLFIERGAALGDMKNSSGKRRLAAVAKSRGGALGHQYPPRSLRPSAPPGRGFDAMTCGLEPLRCGSRRKDTDECSLTRSAGEESNRGV